MYLQQFRQNFGFFHQFLEGNKFGPYFAKNYSTSRAGPMELSSAWQKPDAHGAILFSGETSRSHSPQRKI
jgi:hypothetical protein